MWDINRKLIGVESTEENFDYGVKSVKWLRTLTLMLSRIITGLRVGSNCVVIRFWIDRIREKVCIHNHLRQQVGNL